MQTTGTTTTTTTLTTFAIETVKVFLFMAISQPDASGMVAAVPHFLLLPPHLVNFNFSRSCMNIKFNKKLQQQPAGYKFSTHFFT